VKISVAAWRSSGTKKDRVKLRKPSILMVLMPFECPILAFVWPMLFETPYARSPLWK
jgi:hypothetical protein